MQSLYLWPDNPILSIFVLWLGSAIFLWAARTHVLKLMAQLGTELGGGIDSASKRVIQAADSMAERNRQVLQATGIREVQGRLERELLRMDAGYAEQMENYGTLQRRLDETLVSVERDYQESGVVAPSVPDWSSAVETLAAVPVSQDVNVQKVLEGIKASAQSSEKRALKSYREDAATRLKTLGKMLPIGRKFVACFRA